MADTKPADKAKAAILDFSNVKDRGAFNPKHKSDGDYKARCVKVDETISQAGNAMWVFAIQLDEDASAVYPHRCVLDENNLWKIRNMLVACGLTVPKKRVKVDPQKVVGKELGITLESDEYEGKMKSQVQATFPVSDLVGPTPASVKSVSTAAHAVRDADEAGEEPVLDADVVEDSDLEEIEVEEL